MGKKLYVGNLSYSVNDNSLQQNFSDFGTVSSAKVMMDRDSGRSKGFGFVEMSSDAEAQAAISGMNGKSVDAATWSSMKPARWNRAPVVVAAAVVAAVAVAAMVAADATEV